MSQKHNGGQEGSLHRAWDAVSQTSGCVTGLIRVGGVLAVEGEFLMHSMGIGMNSGRV